MLSSNVQEQFANPHKMSVLEDADVIGQDGIPGAGPFMQIFLNIQEDTITEAHFQTYGCPNAIACGSWVTHWVEGRTLDLAWKLEAEALMKIIGGLPPGKEHCAYLAVNALRSALRRRGEGIR